MGSGVVCWHLLYMPTTLHINPGGGYLWNPQQFYINSAAICMKPKRDTPLCGGLIVSSWRWTPLCCSGVLPPAPTCQYE